jgi:hypothetical protein
LRLDFDGGRAGVRLGTTFISRRAPSATAARDTESIVMVGLAGSSKEWTAIRLVPILRAISEIETLPACRACSSWRAMIFF